MNGMNHDVEGVELRECHLLKTLERTLRRRAEERAVAVQGLAASELVLLVAGCILPARL
ncbi:hypothetical protein [Arthrobacter sp. HMWF013]|uniref:hypothetical protein n=1 Tax=Arthrobacter sp. HMWF013 TaxID=2056849 RepID=UPI001C626665|nr:hypothetical protein [Arthrobacter sp. HMWF013]